MPSFSLSAKSLPFRPIALGLSLLLLGMSAIAFSVGVELVMVAKPEQDDAYLTMFLIATLLVVPSLIGFKLSTSTKRVCTKPVTVSSYSAVSHV